MSPIFFQRFWFIMEAIQNFFSIGHMLKAFNETLITLIPKIDTPVNLSHFKSISLCNVCLQSYC